MFLPHCLLFFSCSACVYKFSMNIFNNKNYRQGWVLTSLFVNCLLFIVNCLFLLFIVFLFINFLQIYSTKKLQARLSVEKLGEHFPACSGKIREVRIVILCLFCLFFCLFFFLFSSSFFSFSLGLSYLRWDLSCFAFLSYLKWGL